MRICVIGAGALGCNLTAPDPRRPIDPAAPTATIPAPMRVASNVSAASERANAAIAEFPLGGEGSVAVHQPDPSIALEYPFAGRWLTQNSPANRVPSHGTTMFGTSYAIDFVPVNDTGRTAPITLLSLVLPEPPQRFPGFGRPLLAPIEGVIAAAHDAEADHAAYRGVPSIGYALTQGRRAEAGWVALAGNHVLIESVGVVVALCHLQQGSVVVQPGQRVRVGDVLGRCGNSGNSTEPHVHVQAIDGRDIPRANAVRLMFRGSLPRNGDIVDAGGERQTG
jgi:murein DD-endopeptidase MepM/ murein hydrolase activator NlpD